MRFQLSNMRIWIAMNRRRTRNDETSNATFCWSLSPSPPAICFTPFSSTSCSAGLQRVKTSFSNTKDLLNGPQETRPMSVQLINRGTKNKIKRKRSVTFAAEGLADIQPSVFVDRLQVKHKPFHRTRSTDKAESLVYTLSPLLKPAAQSKLTSR